MVPQLMQVWQPVAAMVLLSQKKTIIDEKE
jgi:hypothetical protein